MKKILFVFIVMIAMIACGGNTTKQSIANDSISTDSIEVVDSTLIDTISIN